MIMSQNRVCGNSVVMLLGLLLASFPVLAQDAGYARRVGALEQGTLHLAQAQLRPPGAIPDEQMPMTSVPDGGGLVVRIDRLETQLRGLTGQIEQLQFQQRKLDEALRRIQPEPGAAKPGAALPSQNRSDAFNPGARPGAPGAPRSLGTLPQSGIAGQPYPSSPLASDTNNPVDTSRPLDIAHGLGAPAPADMTANDPAFATGLPTPPSNAGQAGSALPPLANLAPQGLPRDEYDQGLAFYKAAKYEAAETSLRAFVQNNPRDRLVATAIFYLGETFSQRRRYREAAEQYLKLSTDYAKSPKAPEALVQLGVSLNQLAAKEQACATFGEVARKYPAAATAIRQAGQEAKRAGC